MLFDGGWLLVLVHCVLFVLRSALVAVCWLLCVGCCDGACCVLIAMRRSLCDVCRLVLIVRWRCVLFVVCRLLFAVCCLLRVGCCVLVVGCGVLLGVCVLFAMCLVVGCWLSVV